MLRAINRHANVLGFNLPGMSRIPTKQKMIRSVNDLSNLSSGFLYVVDGQIDIGTTTIEVPVGGLHISGLGFDVSKLYSSENTLSMFTSPGGGSGNLFLDNMTLEVTGTGSKIFDLTDVNGNNAVEMDSINFNNCTSLGEITDYRQVLETNTGRFGGTPELTFSGSMNGVRISTSIVRGISNITSLFKTGTALVFGGRFISGINADLAASGALFDFSASNFTNDNSLIFDGAYVTRAGVIDASDTSLYPNLNHKDVKSSWGNNTGLPNTTKYISASVTTEVATVVGATNTYYPLAGTFTVSANVSHFDMPANGEFRLTSGNGTYSVSGDIVLESTANDQLDIRVTKSTDDGATWPEVVQHIGREVNNLSGARDVAFFPLNFITDLKKGERLRIEVENKTNIANITAELDSYFIISQT